MSEFVLTPEDQPLLDQISAQLQPLMSDLVPRFYQELRQLAARERRRTPISATLNTTSLVNELYLKFVRNQTQSVGNVEHFMAICAIAMRHLLVDRARRSLRAEARAAASQEAQMEAQAVVLQVHDALARLAEVNLRLTRVVECRWFAGYSEIETASALGISERTVRRDWEKAQLWLRGALQ